MTEKEKEVLLGYLKDGYLYKGEDGLHCKVPHNCEDCIFRTDGEVNCTAASYINKHFEELLI